MANSLSDLGRVPTDWSVLPVADVVEAIRNGTTADQNKDGLGYPVTRIETIADGRVNRDRVRYINVSALAAEPYRLKDGDVLLSHINSVKHIGKVAQYDGGGPLYHGMNLMMLRPNRALVDRRYFYYAISSPKAKQYFEARAKRAINQASLNRGEIASLRLPVPPIPEQRKLAVILSSVDATIEKTEAVIDELQGVKTAMMQEVLTRGMPGRHARFKETEIGRIPEAWRVVELGEVGTIVTGNTPATSDADNWGGRHPFVTPGDMGDNPFVLQTERTVTDKGLRASRELPPMAVLVTCIGATIGKVAMAPARCCSNQQINAIVCGERVIPEYVYYVIQCSKPQLLANASQTAVPIINKGSFGKIIVAVPPVDEQRQIADLLMSVDKNRSENMASVSALQALKSALFSSLLTGEIRVTPDPEPTP